LLASVGAMTNADHESIKASLAGLFSEMHIEVPSFETDLFDSGILDSQRLVELVFQIEQKFQMQVDIEDFEIENFRCIETIAALIAGRMKAPVVPQLSRVVEA
jgi:acyl carrier protein